MLPIRHPTPNHHPMPRYQTLIRLLLCVILLSNGMGSAVASAYGSLMGPHPVHGAEAGDLAGGADAATHRDCPHGALDVAPTPAGPLAVEMDCLEACLDICLQHGHALLVASIAGAWPSVHHLLLAPPAVPRPSLAPFPPLRPPIAR
nr:hypothetical protein BGP89_03685 [Luteimonas sp. JM171]